MRWLINAASLVTCAGSTRSLSIRYMLVISARPRLHSTACFMMQVKRTWVDLPRPLKNQVTEYMPYQEVERRLQQAIARRSAFHRSSPPQ